MVKVCPKCGATDKEKPFIGPFCVDCYKPDLKPPTKLVIYVCPDCGRIRLKKKWIDYSIEAIEDYIAKQTKGNFERLSLDIDRQTVRYVIREGSSYIELDFPVKIVFKKALCDVCSRIHGGYYEAIVQIRGPESEVGNVKSILTKLLKRKTFIVKEVVQKTGVDLYVGDKRVVVDVLSKMGFKPLRTRKLYSVRDGKKVFRYTFLIRLK